MATKIGDYFAELNLRNKKFLQKLKTSQIGMSQLATAGKVALGAVAVAAAAATAAMVLLAKKSITMAVDFDESMRRVNTLAQLGQEGFEGMKDRVLDLSTTLGKSATEMGDALYQVISACFEGADAMIVLETGVKMATAGMAGQVESVDALTTVLNAWGFSAEDATRVSDTFFLTIKYGKTTMGELAHAIGVVATTAANAGLSFEEVGAALSALTIVGVDTNRAVTGLNAVLTALTKPTDEAKEAAAELGIDFSLTGLKAKGLSVWLGELKDATKGESEQLVRFFQNVRAVRAILPLATNAAESFNNNLIKMQTETGAAQEAFEEMDKSYARIIERLKIQFEKIYIAVGEELVPELLEFSRILSDPEFLESVKTVALGMANFATGILKVVRAIGELSEAHKILMEEQEGVNLGLIDNIKFQIEYYKKLIENENKNIIIMGEGKKIIGEYTKLLAWWERKLEQLTSDQRAMNDALVRQKTIIEETKPPIEEVVEVIQQNINRMGEFGGSTHEVFADLTEYAGFGRENLLDVGDMFEYTEYMAIQMGEAAGEALAIIVKGGQDASESLKKLLKLMVELAIQYALMAAGVPAPIAAPISGFISEILPFQKGGLVSGLPIINLQPNVVIANEPGTPPEIIAPIDKLKDLINVNIYTADPNTTWDLMIDSIDSTRLDRLNVKLEEPQRKESYR